MTSHSQAITHIYTVRAMLRGIFADTFDDFRIEKHPGGDLALGVNYEMAEADDGIVDWCLEVDLGVLRFDDDAIW